MKQRVLVWLCALTVAVPFFSQAQQLNVYSARKEALIKPILDKFAEQNDVQINLITGGADTLISRIQREGELSPADVLFTTDVGRLVRAKQAGITDPYVSTELQKHIPANLRDAEHHWFALTRRARTIMYVPERVDPDSLSRLEDLNKPEWQGRLCIRSSSNIYNQSMVATLLAQLGSDATQQWANQFVNAFARPPKGGDRDQIRAVVAGQCDVAIANTYYLAGMLTDSDPATREIAKQVKVLWPNQQDRGTHVNISGTAIIKGAPNKAIAQALLDYMVSEEAQSWYAETNGEYPVREGVAWSQVLTDMGQFKAENVPLEMVGELNEEALKIMDRAGWK
ncbi:Fe(3+) ABC transporter substrate-binding protein [Aestuariibacter salexigens]|uniref:Fe(3+) ABC transporter substrate-binding protein n=1 Tax=Aestuariibacter salexigens TaxID=226010 RepID=UPI00040E22C2|nr:Fe(3+) ABC transporter substrate-binding protein [Aestuariibacter salexigens]